MCGVDYGIEFSLTAYKGIVGSDVVNVQEGGQHALFQQQWSKLTVPGLYRLC